MIGWLDFPFAIILALCAWYGGRTGLVRFCLQMAGALLGFSGGRFVAAIAFGTTGWLGIPIWLLAGGACMGGAILGAFLTNLVAWVWAPRMAAWAPRSDKIAGMLIGLLAGALVWGSLYMGLLGWNWHPWTKAAGSSFSGDLALRYMPGVYTAIDRIFPNDGIEVLTVPSTAH